MGKDYYKLLGVDKGAGEAELKKGAQQARPSWPDSWGCGSVCGCVHHLHLFH
jgi:hypothetical protein